MRRSARARVRRSGSPAWTGSTHLDGPEYSPDGAWLYVNTEEFAKRPGHAQLARVPAGGGGLEQLVESDTADWFPHLSPDAELAGYVSFPAGTRGQGTINVNSWSPDSRRFAFMAYPIDR